MKPVKALEKKIKKLPPDIAAEVEDFVNFLLEKKKKTKPKKLTQSWAGVLEKYKDQYTSVELQKKAMEWR